MKKKILSLLVTGCLLFVPTTAFADDNKTVIKTVDDLLAFSKAVNNGDYDKNKDAVVVLENDLDLTGVVWTPIGNVFDENGYIEHCFSGKFYGNGHTISNIDFTSIYGKDLLVGFFGDIEEAEVSGLTIEGNLDVTNTDNEYTVYGTIAGFAGDCTITDCVSNVSFNNNGKYVYGLMGMVGQADATTFEYCENTADITISGDSGSLYVGGIVGSVAGGSVSDCYFAGEIDLSQYSARKPYTRFGGIVGKDSSSTPDFKNNYFTETEDVEACGSNKEAGKAKAYDYMTTKEFYDELTADGAKYQYVEGKTPVLPTKEYAVDFEVTPADLKNVVIKVDGKEITSNTAMLTAGTYTVDVTADDCEPLSKEITISADIATHTQAFELAYKSADYTELDKAEEAAKALNKDDYEDFSAVEKALAAVDRTKNITEQADVDAMAKAINDAVANLVKKAPASSQPDSENSSDNSSDISSSSASDSSSSDSKATDSKSDSSSKAASNASNTNPSTGVAGGAFALALLSGAAVVMAKKKK